MKKFSTAILLAVIVVIATVLRLWNLGSVPPSPDWDEAALGYNAYSILQTGKDEYGKFMPIVLQSFDDYKPALYTYTIIPFIPLFGVTLIAVRLPSAIFGILTVLATYFLVKELFKRKDIALLSAFLLAISPWHMQFSRVAFETNTGLAFNVFSALFFIKSLKKPWLLSLSAACMALNLSIYQSDRVFTPLLAIMLVALYWKQLFALPKKYLISALVIGVIIASPFFYYLFTNKQALTRAKGVSVFSESTVLLKDSQKRLLDDKNSGNVLGVLLHNRRVVYANEILSGYLSHYDLKWLFIRGDLIRHHAPAMGQMYLWELPFLLLGIYSLLFLPFSKKTKIFVFAWFLLAPIPASITTGVPHAVRTLNFLPTFQIFTAIGLMSAYLFIQKNRFRFVLASFLVFSIIFNFLYYLDQYFVQQNYFVSRDWQYGYEQTVAFVKKNEHTYKKIIVSDQPPLDQSYMFFLFYLTYPPRTYQNEGNVTAGFRENHTFGKFEFRPITWNKEKRDGNILYVGRPEDFPQDIKILKRVNYVDGKPALSLVEGQ